ncbi:MAG: amino acid aminotransferase [Halieaceae bacterium]|nr:amino acid aminotransferase [Halieaceae bacterium]
MFESLERLPADPILGLSAACAADPNPDKIDLTVGVYKNESGQTPVFAAVQRAQEALSEREVTKAYLPQVGDAHYIEGIRKLLLGESHPALEAERVTSVQAPGGCGALRVGAEVIKSANPSAKVWLSAPTWPNHIPLIGSVGLEFKEYRYYDPATHAVDFDGMLADLADAAPGDVLLLHGCCHNPCGADLSPEQWQAVTTLTAERGLMPFIDIAYQGMGKSLDEDAFGVRHMTENLPEVLVAASNSKNMGLYRERTGAIVFSGRDRETAEIFSSQATKAARKIYSMPPAHGAILAGMVLSDTALNNSWREELAAMCERLNGLRVMLDEKLSAATGKDFSFIRNESGMFSFLGLTPEQVDRLREEFSVYMVGSSRVNVAGVNNANVDYLAKAVAAVL